MRALRIPALCLLALLLCGAGTTWLLGGGLLGRFDSETTRPASLARGEAARAAARARWEAGARAVVASPARQILFGDLHVHTTISFDAFMLNLPVLGGEGAHPPADACDFARHCAALDFWSINDHAASIHPRDWRNTIDSIRECNARAGDPEDPDLAAFLGWEWTQVGATPESHYGHKNVVLAHLDDARIPSRPIAATHPRPPPSRWALGALAFQGDRFHDLARRWTALAAVPECPEGDVRELPDDCREVARDPAALFRKLDEWGHDALVIPHGTSWGIYTPPGSSWDRQLDGPMHDPERQTLIEVYSGHGSSEVYRPWRAVERGDDGEPRCPEERPEYLPICRRAGQIVRGRCLDDGGSETECEERARVARDHAVRAGASPHATVAGASAGDWLDAGQCRDCDQPAFKYRPAGSAQYLAAIGRFTGDGPPRRLRLGFIASSDIHNARAGTGFKELRAMTDAGNAAMQEPAGLVGAFLRAPPEPPASHSRPIEEAARKLHGIQLMETERSQSFLYTGGLVAVHADGRSREAIWQSLLRREVYGTSGPRILLWFDLLTGEGVHPMGSAVEQRETPAFRVRAVGSLEQAPGCPATALEALGPEGLRRLCRDECYHPTDTRRPITRIEIVRIRPQRTPEEDVAELIDDPWRRFECPGDGWGCVITFADSEFPEVARDSVYYARAFEAPAPTVNGSTLGCRFDADGRCIATRPCERGEECLAPSEPRAWSSPIWVDYPDP